jgi:putative transposase
VHLIRNALRPVARRDAGEVAKELRKIYTAPDAGTAQLALLEFAGLPWGRKYPQAVRVREAAWEAFTPFLAFSPAVRKLPCTTRRDREPELPAAQGHQGTRPLPDRRRGGQAAVAGHHQHRGQARPRAPGRRAQTGKRSDQPARLVEGQRVMGWREALNELDSAYPGRLR